MIAAGAHLQSGASVQRVIIRDGRAVVVLAAGGIASPRLLQASGLTRGYDSHFSDPVIMLMGSVDDLDGGAEVPMAAGIQLKDEGIMLSDLALPKALYPGITAQVGRFDRITAHRHTLAIMVKIRDKIGGSIGPCWVSKSLHPSDRKKFDRGLELAEGILSHAGARHVFKSWHFAAHPGGSVRIGGGVDSDYVLPYRTCTYAMHLSFQKSGDYRLH